jgi:hypothetical protein
MKIQTYKYPSQGALGHFCNPSAENTSFNLQSWFQIENDIIWFKLINVEEDKTYLNIKLPYSQIMNHIDICDQSLWEFNCSEYINNPENTQDATDIKELPPVTLSRTDITNAFRRTLNNKSTLIFPVSSWNGPFTIFVPYVNSPIEEWIFVVRNTNGIVPQQGEPYTNTFNMTYTGPSGSTATITEGTGTFVRSTNPVWKDLISAPKVDSFVVNDGVINVEISVDNPNIQFVYLEQQVGFINKTKVKLINGIGNFSVLTTGLDLGETVVVRLGYKFFTNASQFTYTL